MNFENIPGNLISGLSDELLEWVSIESGDRYITELSSSFAEELEQMEVFDDVDDDILNAIKVAESEVTPSNTKKQTDYHVKNFKEFLLRKQLSANIEKAPVKILSNYLSYYYFNLKRKDSKPYSPTTLICIRASIQRYLSGPTVNRNINIIDDVSFKRSNGILKAMVKKWLKDDGSTSKQFEAIESEDMEKMRQYFNRENSIKLQQEAWFSIVYHFALRGREVIRDLKRKSISFAKDASGKKFAYINQTYLSKNIKSSLSSKEFENLSQARMYAIPEKIENCPVRCLELYFEKMQDDCENLFPMPLKVSNDNPIWYSSKRPLGKNTIGDMMKEISKSANLNKIYTNHCVRVTVVNNLRNQGLTSNDIAAVTGHKNINSVDRYVRRKTDSEKRTVSQMLSNPLVSASSSSRDHEISRLEEENLNLNWSPDQCSDCSPMKLYIQGNANCTFNFYGK